MYVVNTVSFVVKTIKFVIYCYSAEDLFNIADIYSRKLDLFKKGG